jgi:hypothetical protein
MPPIEFVFWLSGFADINETAPTQEQWNAIRDRLSCTVQNARTTQKPSAVQDGGLEFHYESFDDKDKVDNRPFRNGKLVLKKNGVPYGAQG